MSSKKKIYLCSIDFRKLWSTSQKKDMEGSEVWCGRGGGGGKVAQSLCRKSLNIAGSERFITNKEVRQYNALILLFFIVLMDEMTKYQRKF